MLALVSEWMSGRVIALTPNDTLASARNLMIRKRLGRIFIVDEKDQLQGVVSRTDLALALRRGGPAWRRRPIDETLLGDIMTSKIVPCRPEMLLGEAADLMWKHKVGALPVLSDSSLEGVLSGHDLARFVAEEGDHSIRVKDYYSKDLSTVRPRDSISNVIKTIATTQSRVVVVVDKENLPVGIITPSNLAFLRLDTFSQVTYGRPRAARQAREGKAVKYLGASISSHLMTSPVYVTYENESVRSAASRLVQFAIGSLPVLSSKKQLVGVFSKREVMRVVTEIPS